MKGKMREMFEQFHIDVMGTTVMAHGKEFDFFYTPADDKIIKPEYQGTFRYFGGLQCGYDSDSHEYRQLENRLCDLAEAVLKEIKALKATMQDKIDATTQHNEEQAT